MIKGLTFFESKSITSCLYVTLKTPPFKYKSVLFETLSLAETKFIGSTPDLFAKSTRQNLSVSKSESSKFTRKIRNGDRSKQKLLGVLYWVLKQQARIFGIENPWQRTKYVSRCLIRSATVFCSNESNYICTSIPNPSVSSLNV